MPGHNPRTGIVARQINEPEGRQKMEAEKVRKGLGPTMVTGQLEFEYERMGLFGIDLPEA